MPKYLLNKCMSKKISTEALSRAKYYKSKGKLKKDAKGDIN